MLRVIFEDQASRDAFADRWKIDTKVDDNKLDIGWHLLQAAKLDPKALDYDEVALLQASPNANSEREFIVKGDPATFGAHATVLQDLGSGFYLVKSTDGTLLGDHVDSIEHNSAPMTFLEASTINSFNAGTTAIDPLSEDAQWPRIRVASRYRPLLNNFTTHEIYYKSTPELVIMDTGINFNHPEFQYDGLTFENFYTLPVFNGFYNDDVGHGTAVASMAVGKNLGVCRKAHLVSMKVGGASHSATLLEIGQAIDALLARAANDPNKTRIVNMSWGIARSSWLDAKVQALLDIGMLVVCAAGNSGISVEDISPAGINNVLTIGSVDRYDIPSGFNNLSPTDAGVTTGYGLSLDMFAPGENIVIAAAANQYFKVSGTSFATPLAAGCACDIAALHDTPIMYNELKQILINTATVDALLFEDDRFSDNQNRLVHLLTSDMSSNYKSDNMTSYLGVHEGSEPIVLDLNSVLDAKSWKGLFPDETIVYSVVFLDPAVENDYKQFFSVNEETGVVTIQAPTNALPAETKLKMVDFRGVATCSRAKVETNTLFFFHTNPAHEETKQSDITLALADTNSISFYGLWLPGGLK